MRRPLLIPWQKIIAQLRILLMFWREVLLLPLKLHTILAWLQIVPSSVCFSHVPFSVKKKNAIGAFFYL